MKKNFATIISFVLTILLLINPTYATETINNSSNVVIYSSEEYLGNGIYGKCEIRELVPPYATLALANSTKTATTTYTIVNSSGNALAKYNLTASYSYNGTSSNCISVRHSTEIFDTTWSFTLVGSHKSANFAFGDFTAECKLLFITTQTISKSMNMSCSPTGEITKTVH